MLNATYPLDPEQLVSFCAGKRAVLVLEEGNPEFIEFELAAVLGRAGMACAVRGKAAMATTGEYTAEAMVGGLARFVSEFVPEQSIAGATAWRDEVDTVARRRRRCWERRYRRARRAFASAVRNGRCSAR